MDHLTVADQMNRHPVVFDPQMTLQAAVDRLSTAKQAAGPVIDEHKQVIGFLSEQDCLQRMLLSSYHDEGICYVKDIMQTNVISVKPYTTVVDLAQKMLADKPKIYPVVDDDGLLLGVISRTDVLRAIDQELHSHYRRRS